MTDGHSARRAARLTLVTSVLVAGVLLVATAPSVLGQGGAADQPPVEAPPNEPDLPTGQGDGTPGGPAVPSVPQGGVPADDVQESGAPTWVGTLGMLLAVILLALLALLLAAFIAYRTGGEAS